MGIFDKIHIRKTARQQSQKSGAKLLKQQERHRQKEYWAEQKEYWAEQKTQIRADAVHGAKMKRLRMKEKRRADMITNWDKKIAGGMKKQLKPVQRPKPLTYKRRKKRKPAPRRRAKPKRVAYTDHNKGWLY